ncbi:MAG: aldehyde dehydrogenase [Actinobacteria bacterium]|nr:aldehyde dehydrogenase [Actinomycetota bacterium]|tara:strand:+ start:4822 stop:5649 length:828 start_codon:yes stop_codon:yes gene_type:complete
MTEVKKTYKNYVNGKFVRSESGKVYSVNLKNEKFEIPLTSKKDLRDAVTHSKEGFKHWNKLTMYNRSQILYRLSEMIEGNKDSYISLLQQHGLSKNESKKDVENAINTIVWYSGIVDKWEQLTGNLNPVAGEYFNISHQEPIGVTFSLSSNEVSLNHLVKSFLPAMSVGCSVISFTDENAVLALKLSEDINNSDFPSGSINFITGNFGNIVEDVGGHVEVKLVAIYSDITNEFIKTLSERGADSVKRIFNKPAVDGLASILPFIETKTVWHPKGK